jgi:hypothetical protein
VPGSTVPGGQSTPSRLVRRGRKEEEAEDDDDDDDEEDEMLRLLNHAPVTGLPLWLRLPIPSPTPVAGFRDGILARQLVLIDCALGEDAVCRCGYLCKQIAGTLAKLLALSAAKDK